MASPETSPPRPAPTAPRTGVSRRRFIRRCGVGAVVATAAALTAPRLPAADRAVAGRRRLSLLQATLPDPDGHHAALRLKGDWLLIGVSDGTHTGVGEISHNGNDAACLRRVHELFAAHLAGSDNVELSPARLADLEKGAFATAPDFLTATAISGLNQALCDLAAQRAGVPVWRLFRPHGEPLQRSVPCYLSTNRALRARGPGDFLRAVEAALALGVPSVKITPFEAVTPTGDQIRQAEEGFARLEAVRAAFPGISLRVDCHERFTPEAAARLLPRFAALRLNWLEEPCPPGPALGPLRAGAGMPFAVGELFFGPARFRELLEKRWADVIMPDPKHVGGFSPLLGVCRLAETFSAQVSPHNPSGPVATAAAVHAAAVSAAVTSVELILTSDPARQPGRELLRDGRLGIPAGPGWGLPADIAQRLTPSPVIVSVP